MAIANALQLEAAWATPALCRFNLWHHAKFDVAQPIRCRIIAFLMLTHYFTMWPWPLTFDLCSVSPVTCSNSVSNFDAIEQSAAELLQFHCLILWPWTCFKCCTWLWDNFHQVWPSTTYLNSSWDIKHL